MVKSSKFSRLLVTLLVSLGWLAGGIAAAPAGIGLEQGGTVYVVQPGDTLAQVALRYNLQVTDIIQANNLANPNLIVPGQRLILPVIATPPAGVVTEQFHTVQPGETVYIIATRYGLSISDLVLSNNISNPDLIQVGQTLRISANPTPPLQVLPSPFAAIQLSEPVIIQGRTLVIQVTLSDPAASLSGIFEGQPLFFIDRNISVSGSKEWWSMAPVHALTEPGTYPITLTAHLTSGSDVTTVTDVTVIDGPYAQENISVDEARSELLNADLIQLERENLMNVWSQISPLPSWDRPFQYPLESIRVTSKFGTRRTYNNSSEIINFHEGTDLGGGSGTPVYAAAPGRVALAEQLVVRGNAIVLDHGMGLFSGYWHLSQLVVNQGQYVQAGDLIGYVGDTGLVTGPHLHWEIRLNGIAVEPMQWVQQLIP